MHRVKLVYIENLNCFILNFVHCKLCDILDYYIRSSYYALFIIIMHLLYYFVKSPLLSHCDNIISVMDQ